MFSAILAMDAYQQGNDGALNVTLLGNQGGVGNASVTTDFPDTAHGFFAQAYALNGQTVISHRGTDQGILPPAPDLAYGYGVGAGVPDAAQGQDAISFYNQVAASQDGTISIVGQSLGGG